jgi:hypothetical protein
LQEVGEPPEEGSEAARGVVRSEWSRVFPVTEADPVVVGAASEVHDDARDDEAVNKGDCGISGCTRTDEASLLLIIAKTN